MKEGNVLVVTLISVPPCNKSVVSCFLSKVFDHNHQSRRDEIFIVSGLHKAFAAPEERQVADSNRRLQHFAPPELWALGYVPCL